MAQHFILIKPKRLKNISFEDRYADISSDWQGKAERLQARRWRHLRHLGI